MGAIAVIANPINKNAIKFYEKWSFEPLLASERMFSPMNAIEQLI